MPIPLLHITAQYSNAVLLAMARHGNFPESFSCQPAGVLVKSLKSCFWSRNKLFRNPKREVSKNSKENNKQKPMSLTTTEVFGFADAVN
jgi:hypothetical protein